VKDSFDEKYFDKKWNDDEMTVNVTVEFVGIF
jgi:hypothetical protein